MFLCGTEADPRRRAGYFRYMSAVRRHEPVSPITGVDASRHGQVHPGAYCDSHTPSLKPLPPLPPGPREASRFHPRPIHNQRLTVSQHVVRIHIDVVAT
ncbi:hypothetical protein L249_5819 [Ophiocordyceps polyrhachis-furcata BCC 54312]|uniref:Uncharacterized protein n=1 Tax=Ophiocordyceps polyrhachis-furcata BCC 54312 TaxID=1330021 RepID=A0A367L0H3_9HYPO|nr:hypothetical protein L249_5819 [Ophiocordyceps polyrhachis-furcata BCC 54312]